MKRQRNSDTIQSTESHNRTITLKRSVMNWFLNLSDRICSTPSLYEPKREKTYNVDSDQA